MQYHSQHALNLLQAGTGRPDAEFREGQEHAIRHVVDGRGPTTGGAEDRMGQELETDEDRAEQKSMANSTQQARNVDGSLVVSVEPLPLGPVLLVDDMVDSRWTLTVAAWLLRSHGSGEVWPLALALTSHG